MNTTQTSFWLVASKLYMYVQAVMFPTLHSKHISFKRESLCLVSPGLSKDIQCHVRPHSFLRLQITRLPSKIDCQPGDWRKWLIPLPVHTASLCFSNVSCWNVYSLCPHNAAATCTTIHAGATPFLLPAKYKSVCDHNCMESWLIKFHVSDVDHLLMLTYF